MATINITNEANDTIGSIRPYVRGRVALLSAEAYVQSLNIFMSCGMYETMQEAEDAILSFQKGLC